MGPSFQTVPSPAPAAAARPTPFILHISDQEIEDLHQLLRLSKIGPSTWWNEQADRRFGITREWLTRAKDAWLNSFDWRKTEGRVNALPNFKTTIKNDGQEHDVHFAALFSARQDAIPVIFMHGWPGSFLEFLPMMELLAQKYSPDTLPYHVVVPSIPEYGLSTRKDHDAEMTIEHAAGVMNTLMVQLGFGTGYVAQGGDVGSALAETMALTFQECKAFHLNMSLVAWGLAPPPLDGVTPEEQAHLQRSQARMKIGSAYALEQGTRPATIGHVLSSSPLAMLAWIGEKYLEWVDDREPLSLDTTLSMVSFYWFTDTFPRSIYPYRSIVELVASLAAPSPVGDIDTTITGEDKKSTGAGVSRTEKPFGFSAFPQEMSTLPKAWAEQLYPSLMTYKSHEVGGHFAALEQPKVFLRDVEEFLQKVGPKLNKH